MLTKEQIKELLPHATAKEAEALTALADGATYARAGEVLGLPRETVRTRVREVRRRAQHRAGLPEGQRLKGASILTDGAGNLKATWEKTELASDDPPAFETIPEGHHVRKVSTMLDAQGNTRIQWIQSDQDKAQRESDMLAAFDRHVERYKGLAPIAPPPVRTLDELITIYNLGDPHIGMLAWAPETGEDFDLKIAERDLLRTVDLLVSGAPASGKAVLANLGDFFHADNDLQVTPGHGHKLDVDSRQAKVFDVGCSLMRRMIDRLLERHGSVDVRNVPGNHDPMTSRFLAKWLAAVYENEPRVIISPNLDPYSYLRFGANLFGWAHGDGAKIADLPMIMACDEREAWGETEFHFWFGGHIHHKTRHEFAACSVETFNTLAARDMWHHHKGYRASRYLSAITFDELWGEVTRSQVGLKRSRAE